MGVNANFCSSYSSLLKHAATADGTQKTGALEPLTIKVRPEDVNVGREKNGKLPPTITISGQQAEKIVFKHYGYDPAETGDRATLNKRLGTENPFDGIMSGKQYTLKLENGKYVLQVEIEMALKQQIQGLAKEAQTAKQSPIADDKPTSSTVEEKAAFQNTINNAADTKAALNAKYDQPSMSARQTTVTESVSNAATDALDALTGTDTNGIGASINRQAVSAIKATGRMLETIGATESGQILQGASSEVTRRDARSEALVEKSGASVPLIAQIGKDADKLVENVLDAAETTILGDFSERRSTGAIVGRVVGGLHPAGDVRDIIANTKSVAENKRGAYISLGAAMVGAIPIAGDIAKPAIKAEKEAIAEGAEALLKNADEVATSATKQVDDVASQSAKTVEADKQTAQLFPRGFDNAEQFSKAVGDIKSSVKVDDATVGVRGSSVTGVKFKSGEAFDSSSDVDFFVISDKLYAQGVEKGAKGTNGALKVGATRKYFPEVHEVEKSLSEQLGRKVTIRIFNQEGFDAVKAGEEIVVK